MGMKCPVAGVRHVTRGLNERPSAQWIYRATLIYGSGLRSAYANSIVPRAIESCPAKLREDGKREPGASVPSRIALRTRWYT
jgi:hypothetical protein